jgi:malonyl-CoA O-methyltransferase
VIPFADMHNIGDGLIRAGLVEPVLDVLRFTLTYPDVLGLMRDLKAIGAQNPMSGRPRGLTGRKTMHAVEAAYERHRQEGRLPASYEVIFGQAWGAIAHGDAERDGEFAVPIGAIGRRGQDPA